MSAFMYALVADKLKFRGAMLLLSFVPLLHPSVTFGQNVLEAPPLQSVYNCHGMLVDEDTYAALTELAELNQPIVDELFSIEVSCGGVFSLDYAPVLVEVETPTGEIVRVPELETIPGKYVYAGDAYEPFECEIFGYWESDFTQPPWIDTLTPEQFDQLTAVNGVIGLVWAKLSTAQGEVFVSWQIIQFDTGVADPARAVILLADGTQATGSEVREFGTWRSIVMGWLGEGVSDDPPPPDDPPHWWGDPPQWEAPPSSGTPLFPPAGPPGWDEPVPKVPCEDNPEYQSCLEYAKTAYYDCLKKAYEDAEGCVARAAGILAAIMVGCVVGGLAPWPFGLLIWAVCAAGATANYYSDVSTCKSTYRLDKATCRADYFLNKMGCCYGYE